MSEDGAVTEGPPEGEVETDSAPRAASNTLLSRRRFFAFLLLVLGLAYEGWHRFIWYLERKLWTGGLSDAAEVFVREQAAALGPDVAFPCGDTPSRVVVVRKPDLEWTDENHFPNGGWVGRPRREHIGAMVDSGMRSLMDTDDVAEAWGRLFAPHETVAVKLTWTVHLWVAEPILLGLIAAGVKPQNITVYDFRQLWRAWWEPKDEAPMLISREPGMRLFNEIADDLGVRIGGGSYLPDRVRVGNVKTQLDRCLGDCDALVNVPCVKTHFGAETTIALKNHQGSHTKPHLLHTTLDASLALLNAQPLIRDKTRLIVADATAPLYDGGPVTRNCPWSWKYNGILLSRDPVALDSVGVGILGAERARRGLSATMPRSRRLLANAESLRLGRHDPAWIERVDLTV